VEHVTDVLWRSFTFAGQTRAAFSLDDGRHASTWAWTALSAHVFGHRFNIPFVHSFDT